jgi:hypothetical protein
MLSAPSLSAKPQQPQSLFKEGRQAEARTLFSVTEAKMTPFPDDGKDPLTGNANNDDLFLWLACKEAKALLNTPSAAQP